jgi:predicted nucleic acid-binding protein
MKVNFILVTEENRELLLGLLLDSMLCDDFIQTEKVIRKKEISTKLVDSKIVISSKVMEKAKNTAILILEYQNCEYYVSKNAIEEEQMTELELMMQPNIKSIKEIKSKEVPDGSVIRCKIIDMPTKEDLKDSIIAGN